MQSFRDRTGVGADLGTPEKNHIPAINLGKSLILPPGEGIEGVSPRFLPSSNCFFPPPGSSPADKKSSPTPPAPLRSPFQAKKRNLRGKTALPKRCSPKGLLQLSKHRLCRLPAARSQIFGREGRKKSAPGSPRASPRGFGSGEIAPGSSRRRNCCSPPPQAGIRKSLGCGKGKFEGGCPKNDRVLTPPGGRNPICEADFSHFGWGEACAHHKIFPQKLHTLLTQPCLGAQPPEIIFIFKTFFFKGFLYLKGLKSQFLEE